MRLDILMGAGIPSFVILIGILVNLNQMSGLKGKISGLRAERFQS